MNKILLGFLLLLSVKASAQAPNISYTGPQNYTTGISITPLIPSNSGGAVPATIYSQVITLAGTSAYGSTNGPGTSASFNSARGLAADAAGNTYVADAGNNMIRKITPSGLVSTLAGNGSYGSVDGTGTTATFGNPLGVAVDASGNVYVADYNNQKIRKITPLGVVSTFAGNGSYGTTNGAAANASFSNPCAIAIDGNNNIYVADAGYNLIRKITPAGLVSTLAGSGSQGSANGVGTAASFYNPCALAVDASGNVYVADRYNHLIRMITPSGVVSTFAGNGVPNYANGTGTAASFNNPAGLAIDAAGNLYVADNGNFRIRMITPNKVVTTIAGNGTSTSTNGVGLGASFNNIGGMAVDGQGNLMITDAYSFVKRISITGYAISQTLPAGLSFDSATGTISGTPIAVTPATNYTLSAYNITGASAANVSIATIIPQIAPVCTSISPTSAQAGAYIIINGTNLLGASSVVIGGVAANFTASSPVLISAQVPQNATSGNVVVTNAYGSSTLGGFVFVPSPNISYAGPQSYTTGTAITSLSPTNNGGPVNPGVFGQVSTIAGSGFSGNSNGTGNSASFYNPQATATDMQGNIYVADQNNQQIRKITPAGTVSTFAGSGLFGFADGPGTTATFNSPSGLAVDGAGNVFVADFGNNRIRKITPAGNVTTFAGSGGAFSINGTGVSASFNHPYAIAIDATGNLFVSENGGNMIRKISAAGVVTTLAGNSSFGSTNGIGTSASFNSPMGIAVDISGNVYVADKNNNLIRKITPAGVVTTLAGSGLYGSLNGAGINASFQYPNGVAVDAAGNVYVSDSNTYLIRMITPAGMVSTLAGNGQSKITNAVGLYASFGNPTGISTDGTGNLIITEGNSNLIRKISITGYTINPSLPQGLILDSTTGTISGTPTIASNASAYTVTAYSINGISVATVNIATVIPAVAPVITSFSPANASPGSTILINGNNLLGVTSVNIGGINTMFNSAQPTAITAIVPASASSGNILITNPYGTASATGLTFSTAPAISYSTPQTYIVGTPISQLSPSNTGGSVPASILGQVSTIAGSSFGFSNGTGSSANFEYPISTAVDATGNIYVADSYNNLIRKITPAGVVSTFAGSSAYGNSDGVGTAASFNGPTGITIDGLGNLYVADFNNNIIRKITPAGIVTTLAGSGVASFADGTGNAASFTRPQGITIDGQGNLYVTDSYNNRIRKISPTGVVSTIAGNSSAGSINGSGLTALFNNPKGIACDVSGNLYVADQGNNQIRKITPAGIVSLYAGNGSQGSRNGAAATATFNGPAGLCLDYAGNVYVADQFNNQIRVISTNGIVSTLAGNLNGSSGLINGVGVLAGFYYPAGVTFDGQGNLIVSDQYNSVIRKISLSGYTVTPALPGGLSFDNTTGIITGTPAASPQTSYTVTATNNSGTASTNLVIGINYPAAPSISYAGPQTYFTGIAISPLTPANSGGAVIPGYYGAVSTLAGTGKSGAITGTATTSTFSQPRDVAVDPSGNTYVIDDNNYIRKITPTGQVSIFAGSGAIGSLNGTGTAASFSSPVSLTADGTGTLYVADNNIVRKITPSGVVSTIAGNGTNGYLNGKGTAAAFQGLSGIAVDVSGNIYVSQSTSNVIRKIAPDGTVTTLAGSGYYGSYNGVGTSSAFSGPAGIAVDAAGNVYVADSGNNLIRKITSAGVVTTLAGSGASGITDGTGTAASFNIPNDVSVDQLGNVIVVEYGGHTVRKITPAGVVTTIAGNGTIGYNNAVGNSATFSYPYGVATDLAGNIFIADMENSVIRKIPATGYSISPTLPAGLSFDNTTGTISGIATSITPALNYTISAYNGTANSIATLNLQTVIPKVAPTLTNFTPANTITGTVVSITGANLLGVTSVNFGSAAAASFTIVSPNNIIAVVASTSTSGNISITNPYGTTTTPGFTFSPPPIISYTGPQNFITGTAIAPLSPVSTGGIVPANAFSQATLLAGGSYGSANGTGSAASFSTPVGVATDLSGNTYVADQPNNLIRKITPAGVVTTLAGNSSSSYGDGTGSAAFFYSPSGVAVDASGNVFVADYGNNRIRKITPAGVVTTLAGNGNYASINGTGTSASFYYPYAITIDATGNLYVADVGSSVIRKVTQAGVVTTLAGSGYAGFANGTGSSASFNSPSGLTVDNAGNVYVSDSNNNLIRMITPAGVVSTFAGTGSIGITNGAVAASSFNHPTGINIDPLGNLYIADSYNNRVRMITVAGITSTLAGPLRNNNGVGSPVTSLSPMGIANDGTGNIIVADRNGQILKIATTGYNIDPALPAGLNFDNSTGTISGTPTELISSTNYTVTAYNIAGSSTANLTITTSIPAIAPTITSFTPTSGIPLTPITITGKNFLGATGVSIGGVPVLSYSVLSPSVINAIIGLNTATGNVVVRNPYGADSLSGYKQLTSPSISYAVTGTQSYFTGTQITPLTVVNSGGVIPNSPYGQVLFYSSNYYRTPTSTPPNFYNPHSSVIDVAGNVYVADYNNNVIKKITPAGVVTIFAGNGTIGYVDGIGAAASFAYPWGLAIDALGNIYVADSGNNRIRKITPSGLVTTLAGTGTQGSVNGQGNIASFNTPTGVALDAGGNVYVADRFNNMIRKITPLGVVSNFAGSGLTGAVNGTGTAASFSNPIGITIDAAGNLYIADQSNGMIRKITPARVVSTLASSGSGALLLSPAGVAVDANGNVYVADVSANQIKVVNPAGVISIFAGNGASGLTNGTGTDAAFNAPIGVTLDGLGNLLVADANNNSIRKICLTGFSITPALPSGLVLNNATGTISGVANVVAPANNYTVTAINAIGSSTYNVSIAVAPLPLPNISYQTPQTLTQGVAAVPLIPVNKGGAIPAISGQVTTYAGTGSYGSVNGSLSTASFTSPVAMVIDTAGNMFTIDEDNGLIRKITAAGIVSTFAGNGANGFADGTGTAASFAYPQALAIDADNNIYVADSDNSRIRKITPAGIVTTFAGNGSQGAANGTGTAATFSYPSALAFDVSGNLLVADAGNNMIRKITPAGVVTTLAGTGAIGSVNGSAATSSFNNPLGIAVDATGNIYVADQGNNLIRKITPANIVSTFAGTGPADSTANSTGFVSPLGLATDSRGNVYVADEFGNKVWAITPAGVVTQLAGNGSSGSINGTGTSSSFNLPSGLTLDKNGNLYVADEGSNLIRKISLYSYNITPALPTGLTFDNTNGIISGTPKVTSPATDYTVSAYNFTGVNNTKVNLAVLLPQNITFAPITDVKYGSPDFAPAVTSSNIANAITFTSTDTTVAVITSKNMVHIIGAGTTKITALQTGTSVYSAAIPVSQGLTVNTAPLTVSAVNLTKPYGSANPPLKLTYSGFTNGDDSTKLTKAPIINTTATSSSPAGSYPLTISGALSKNYTITYNAAALAVTPVPLVISVNNLSKNYGEALPKLTVNYKGFVNGDDSTKLTVQPVITTAASKVSGAGSYGITVSGASAANYTINYNGGTLTINPVAITITAKNQSRNYGDPNPPLTVSYKGFVNGDDSTRLSVQPLITTTASKASGIGSYGITVSGASAANYTINYIGGTLTINPALLTVIANDQSRNYGDNNPQLTFTYNGFVNGDNANSLTVKPTVSTPATNTSAAGKYPIIVGGSIAANYVFNYINGVLTVVPVPVIASFNPAVATTGTIITITGVNFTGTTAVSFNGTPASAFSIVSPTTITAVVGAGTSGDVSVTNAFGSHKIAGFSYVFTLPATNFKLTTIGATCKGSANGSIQIIAAQHLNYTATITGNSGNIPYNFTDSVKISNLTAGTYNVCMSVAGQSNYQQCYTVIVTEPKDLSVYTAVNKSTNSVVLTMEGGSIYNVNLNGVNYTTTSNFINLSLEKGNNQLTVTTDKYCQGIVEKTISTSDEIMAYPNPFTNVLNINLASEFVTNTVVEVYSLYGRLVSRHQYVNQSNSLSVDLSALQSGVYLLKVTTDHSEKISKIIKK